jgi:hypothetical protein
MMFSPEHRVNLEKLANYLDSLPEDYEHFDMRTFLTHQGECDIDPDVALMAGEDYLDNCGTVACAVGHGPAAGIPMNESEAPGGWEMYARRVFGTPFFSGKFDYLFGPSWESIDNTPRGAAARIRLVLSGEEFSLYDLSPASYAPYLR